ncbi:unnamed protein product [Sphacelaria rigidula]
MPLAINTLDLASLQSRDGARRVSPRPASQSPSANRRDVLGEFHGEWGRVYTSLLRSGDSDESNGIFCIRTRCFVCVPLRPEYAEGDFCLKWHTYVPISWVKLSTYQWSIYQPWSTCLWRNPLGDT